MPIPYVESSGRRPHLWRIRADGWREFLLSKGWTMCGAYSAKHIRRRLVMVTIIEKHDDHFLCRFQFKHDLWADVTAAFREREAAQRRGAFKVVQGTASEAIDSDSIDSEWAGDDEAIGIGLTFSSPREVERIWSNAADYLEDDGGILADRILQREATGLLLDPERHELLARQAECWLEILHSAVPDTQHIGPSPDYEAGALWVELYSEDVETLLRNAYRHRDGAPRFRDRDFDALADRLDLWRADFQGEAVLELRFRAYFSVTHAVAAFKDLPCVMSAEPLPEYSENSPDIAAAPAGKDAYAVVVRGAYNERTFRTTTRRYRFFLVSDTGRDPIVRPRRLPFTIVSRRDS